MLKSLNVAEVVFELGEEIGADGRNSRTFKAHDQQLDAVIVVKQLDKKKMDSPDKFFNESKLLYLSGHSNVCQIHYACADAEFVYIAMPFYKNGSIKTRMSSEYLTVREIVVAGCQAASGLHNIHSKKLVHLDIKPDNLLISDRGEAIISDFGQAAQLNLFGKAKQNRLYSKGVAPEAVSSKVYDNRFDIYQLGLTLYRMCNGNNDFDSQFSRFLVAGQLDTEAFAKELMNGTFPDRSRFLPHIPSNLRTMIKTCLEVDPSKRFPTAIAASNALATIQDGLLDWRYSQSGSKEVWVRNREGTLCEVTRHASGKTECYRITDSGNRRRDNSGALSKASDTQLRGILKDLK